MTKLPPDFSVTDSHREYCETKWGHPMLADTFIREFVEYWTEGEGKGKTKSNWNKAFTTGWIRRASPLETTWSGRWEKHLNEAKQLEGRAKERKQPVYSPIDQPQPPTYRPMPDILKSLMEKMR